MPEPAKSPIEILFIEDSSTDARVVEVLLDHIAPGQFAFSWAGTMDSALIQVRSRRFDIALLDLTLPDCSGVEAVSRLRFSAPDLPIVVLTGADDDELALEAVHAGAQDYLIKGQGSAELIRRSIRYAIERSSTEAELRRSEEQFRAVFENAGLGIGLIDRKGRIFSVNPALMRLLGDDPGPKGSPFFSYIHPDEREESRRLIKSLLDAKATKITQEVRIVPRSGQIAWARLNASAVGERADQPDFLVALVEDITAGRMLEDQQRLAAKVLDSTDEGIFVTDAKECIIHVNPSFSRLTGFESAEVIGKRPAILASGRHDDEFFIGMHQALKEEGRWQGEIWNRRKTGEIFAVWMTISAVKNDHGAVSHFVSVFSDITSRKESEERLHHQIHHDTLTGLPNRALFLERLERALVRAQRNQLSVGVLFLDLDHFKQINDTLGHLAGDTLLQQVAERLAASIRNEDTVARLAGDEFTLILEDIGDFRDAATVAQKILRQFSLPFPLAGRPMRVSTSIGIALYPTDGTDLPSLLHQADEAMYAAKKQGRDSFRFASPDISEKAFEHQSLETALERAIEGGGLEMHYQPIIRLEDGRTIAVEALLRWRHPEIGLMLPGQFLQMAQENGHIIPIGRWVTKTAIGHLGSWRRGGAADLRLCLNLSRAELHDPDYLGLLKAELDAAEVPAAAIDIEIAESLAMEAQPSTLAAIGELRGLGCRVALDDFGTGGTDFRRLRNLPVDVLKLSAEFIRGMTGESEEARLVEAATAIAHSLGLAVIAKAVETHQQYRFLKGRACDAAQGYFFSRPVPMTELPRLLERRLIPEHEQGRIRNLI